MAVVYTLHKVETTKQENFPLSLTAVLLLAVLYNTLPLESQDYLCLSDQLEVSGKLSGAAHRVVVTVFAHEGCAGVARGVGAALTHQVTISLREECGSKHTWGQ